MSRITAKEISDQLSSDTEAVVKILLPNGVREGNEWRVGSIGGEAGQSLGVRLEGGKRGTWKDFASDEGGDLIDLWAATEGISLKEAIAEVKQYLGIQDPQFVMKKQSYDRPTKPQCTTPNAEVKEYLINQRKLSPETIAVYKVAEMRERGQAAVLFPYLRNGELIAAKRLMIARQNGKKDIRPTSSNQEHALFGWQAIPENAREVTICEGEIDAMSLFQYGYPALSVPFGGGKGEKQRWIENEFENLLQFDTIYLCMDSDQTGQDGATEIAGRLGVHRCKLVELPHKDANDCLLAGVESLDSHFKAARIKSPSELKNGGEFFDEVMKRLYPDEDADRGMALPWQQCDDLRFRKSETTVWAGASGHGKSQILSHVTIDGIKQGYKFCIASMEMPPPRLLERKFKQAGGMGLPSRKFAEVINDFITEGVWLFSITGTAKVDKIFESFEFARRVYGVDHFIIDSMAKCGIAEDDYVGQKALVERLVDFANQHNVHCHLVVHVKKGDSENKPFGKYDIKGTGAITDMVDNVVIVWRNKPKEQMKHAITASDITLDKKDREVLVQGDALLSVVKQRETGDEPDWYLWFDRASCQYRKTERQPLFRYVDFTIHEVSREVAQ
jgi:twinkle protein